ncbi:hypothetical protein V8E54_008766 [Elaphomyces granulatus]
MVGRDVVIADCGPLVGVGGYGRDAITSADHGLLVGVGGRRGNHSGNGGVFLNGLATVGRPLPRGRPRLLNTAAEPWSHVQNPSHDLQPYPRPKIVNEFNTRQRSYNYMLVAIVIVPTSMIAHSHL